MTPIALSVFKDLMSLNVPREITRKVIIRSDGRCDFSALSDPEFDTLAQEVRRRWPDYADPAHR